MNMRETVLIKTQNALPGVLVLMLLNVIREISGTYRLCPVNGGK